MALPIPEGWHSVNPYLIVQNAAEAIEFYKKAFGAEEIMRSPSPDGKSVMHAEIKIGNSIVMISDEFPDMGAYSPKKIGGTPVTLYMYVDDADAVYDRAVKAGATGTMPPQDMFWGDRYGRLTDPYGHNWSIATHMKDLTPEQIQEGAVAAFG